MFSTIGTLMRAAVAEADEELVDRNAATLLAQHLRDAKAEMARRKQGVAMLMASATREDRRIAEMEALGARREKEALVALDAGEAALGEAIADDILRIQDDIADARAERDRLRDEVTKARIGLDKAEQSFIRLSDQLRQARARGATTRPVAARPESALKKAEEMAETLAARQAREADLATAHETLEAEAANATLAAKMEASGLYDDRAGRRAALLEKLKTKGDDK